MRLSVKGDKGLSVDGADGEYDVCLAMTDDVKCCPRVSGPAPTTTTITQPSECSGRELCCECRSGKERKIGVSNVSSLMTWLPATQYVIRYTMYFGTLLEYHCVRMDSEHMYYVLQYCTVRGREMRFFWSCARR